MSSAQIKHDKPENSMQSVHAVEVMSRDRRYVDPSGHFSFHYPADWSLRNDGPLHLFAPNGGVMTLTVLTSDADLGDKVTHEKLFETPSGTGLSWIVQGGRTILTITYTPSGSPQFAVARRLVRTIVCARSPRHGGLFAKLRGILHREGRVLRRSP